MHVFIYVCMIYIICTNVLLYVYKHLFLYMYVFTNACMYVSTYVCIFMCMYLLICTHAYGYVCIYVCLHVSYTCRGRVGDALSMQVCNDADASPADLITSKTI